MNTQVIFKINKELKEKAMKKAQSQGLAFGSILKLATQAYVDGKLSVSLTPDNAFNNATQKDILKALNDIKAHKNISPSFNNAKSAIEYLKK